MRVALDVSAVPPKLAGAGRYIAELARRLPEHAITTSLVTRRDDEARWKELSPSATTFPLVPSSRVQRLAYEAVLLGTSDAAKSADVWHSPHYTMPHRRSIPTVVTIHDLTFFTNPEWHESSKVAFFRRAISYAATHADVLISVSDFTARQIDEFLPGHAPVVVAPHGVDLTRFSLDNSQDEELFATFGYDFTTPYVFFLGTFEPRKGIDVLLAAFELLAQKNPEVELWLAGQSGWGLEQTEAMFTSHIAKDRIRRLGFVDEQVLPALLRHARVVAYPSRGEGFGLPVLEALACGASVVTSANTVMSEVAGDAASVVAIGNADELASSIEVALQRTPSQREETARVARNRAESFTWDFSIARHLDAYELARRG